MLASVAAACIEKLTKGQKLSSSDYTGLLNFAEELEPASKKLSGEYELEASTMSNLRQIVKRSPNYLVNKWVDPSFAIQEKGSTPRPRLSDLAKFVKRKAAVKNDLEFVNEKRPEKKTEPHTRPPTLCPKRQTDAFSTDLKTGRPNVDPQDNERRSPDLVVNAV